MRSRRLAAIEAGIGIAISWAVAIHRHQRCARSLCHPDLAASSLRHHRGLRVGANVCHRHAAGPEPGGGGPPVESLARVSVTAENNPAARDRPVDGPL
jgi:hypothetical protein